MAGNVRKIVNQIPKTETSFGLRDPVSGDFVRLQYYRHEGAEAGLTLEDHGADSPVLSYKTLNDLLAATCQDPPWWYYATPETPQWADVDVAAMIPVRFTQTQRFDGLGSAPISSEMATEVVVMPNTFAGKSHYTRHDTPEIVVGKVFGDGWRAGFEVGDSPELIIIDLNEGDIAGDMIVFNEHRQPRQIVSVVNVPEDWPSDRREGSTSTRQAFASC